MRNYFYSFYRSVSIKSVNSGVYTRSLSDSCSKLLQVKGNEANKKHLHHAVRIRNVSNAFVPLHLAQQPPRITRSTELARHLFRETHTRWRYLFREPPLFFLEYFLCAYRHIHHGLLRNVSRESQRGNLGNFFDLEVRVPTRQIHVVDLVRQAAQESLCVRGKLPQVNHVT